MEEPTRKCYLDVLLQNLKVADRFALSSRFTYIGEYFCSSDHLLRVMSNLEKKINQEYDKIVMTGLLLIYPGYFVHLLETTEKSMFYHYLLLFEYNQDILKLFGKVVILPTYHRIYKMYFKKWYSLIIPNPPALLDPIIDNDLEEVEKQIKNCLFRVYSLCELIMDNESKCIGQSNTLNIPKEILVPYLPEITVVIFLLNSPNPVLRNLRNYYKNYQEVPTLLFYSERIWPPTKDFAPQKSHLDFENEEN